MELSLPVICKPALPLLTLYTPIGVPTEADTFSSLPYWIDTAVYAFMHHIDLHETVPKPLQDTLAVAAHRLLTLANVNDLTVQLGLAFPHGRALVGGAITHRSLHLLV